MDNFTLTLNRDSFETPWGFRLQGGKDFSQPLIISKVYYGSPAYGELYRGDYVLSINGRSAKDMIHKVAMDLIVNSGGQLILGLNRTGSENIDYPVAGGYVAPPAPYTPSGGGCAPIAVREGTYRREPVRPLDRRPIPLDNPVRADTYMLTKVNSTVSNLAMHKPAEWSRKFANQRYSGAIYSPDGGNRRSMVSPGFTGGGSDTGGQQMIFRNPGRPAQSTLVPTYAPNRPFKSTVETGDAPWRGTLNPSGRSGDDDPNWTTAPHPQQQIPPWATTRRQRKQRPLSHADYGEYEQFNGPPQGGLVNGGDQSQLQNLQYNSPIGLYSQQNIQQSLGQASPGGPQSRVVTVGGNPQGVAKAGTFHLPGEGPKQYHQRGQPQGPPGAVRQESSVVPEKIDPAQSRSFKMLQDLTGTGQGLVPLEPVSHGPADGQQVKPISDLLHMDFDFNQNAEPEGTPVQEDVVAAGGGTEF